MVCYSRGTSLTTIVIDSNNLCYRSFFVFSELSYQEKKTGIIFGLLQQILSIAKEFKTNKFIFCWDSKKNYRKVIYPEYKATRRRDLTEEEEKDYALAFKQFDLLRETVLPKMGFRNIFRQNGYEADDLIAHTVKNIEGDFIVVSTDQDLYQLLDKCSIYNWKTKKIVMEETFSKKYNINCKKWAEVKSMVGDPSDNIKGIFGIGEGYSIKYLNNELKKGKHLDKILSNRAIVRENLRLIKLPFKGKKKIKISLQEDSFDKKNFIDVFVDYGFESFLNKDQLKIWEDIFVKNQFLTV